MDREFLEEYWLLHETPNFNTEDTLFCESENKQHDTGRCYNATLN